MTGLSSNRAQIVVVGGSLAGLRAVEALRRLGYGGRLTLVGDESVEPYDRPPLSKQLLRGEWSRERLSLRKQGLSDLDLSLKLGVAATALRPRDSSIELSDGSQLRYDGLVIASGAAPRRLPSGHALQGVHVLRTLADVAAIAERLRTRPRVCVIGGGFIGLEVAASCRTLGLEVRVVESLERPLVDKLGPVVAQEIARRHRERGVELSCGVSVSDLQGAGRVERVVLSDGSWFPADLVVVGIGVRPNTDWLAGSGVELEDGVRCDQFCATNVEGVVAAGDVARWHNPLLGEAVRVEHWSNAVEQAAAAATRLLHGAAAKPFVSVPYFWSDQYDFKLQFAGRARAGDRLTLLEDGASDGGKLLALYSREQRLTAVAAIGRPAQLIKYRRLLSEGIGLAEAIAQA